MARKPPSELRETLVAEAHRLIGAEGLAALTARRLAGLGACSVGTLYNVFGHLDGVVRAANRVTMRKLHEALARSAQEAGPATEDRLLALADAYLDFAAANPHHWDALYRHRLETPPERPVEPEAARLLALLSEAAPDGMDEEAVLALWAAVHGVVELYTGNRFPIRAAQAPRPYLRRIVSACLAELSGRDAGRTAR